MINKTVPNVQIACQGVKDAMTFMLGGFAPEKTSSFGSKKSPSLLKSINPL